MIRLMFLLIYLAPGSWSTHPPPNTLTISQSKQHYQLKIVTNCTRDFIQLKIDLGKPFKGLVFAKEFSEECRARGNTTSTLDMIIPAMGCGVRSEPKDNGLIEMSVKLVIQMDGKLRQSADMVKMAKCFIPNDMMGMNIIDGEGLKLLESKKTNRNGRMKFDAVTPIPAPQPRVRIWLELGGNGGSGAVEVGQQTTLGVRALLPNSIGVRVVDCAALDGLGEASQKLLDERGCPIDEQVMPALIKRVRPIDLGKHHKHNNDDVVEKLFTATFPAFKFPDRERLHVSCGVQLCHGKCPQVDCKSNEAFLLLSDKHLARIEVFNSLSVTAPQIELDRVQIEKKTKFTETDKEGNVQARRVSSEGTLCLSMSKLALVFCILGFIFLLAVIIAVCCMLRARSRDKNYGMYGTSVFSSNSSTTQSPVQSRFGSKLLIPYQSGATLPYGRVY